MPAVVDAAAEAGAEVRQGFSVRELVRDDGSVTGIVGHGKDGGPVREQTHHDRLILQ